MNIYKLSAALLAALTLGLGACSPDYETQFDRSLLEVPHKSQRMINFDREGGEASIEVVTNVPLEKWHAEANADWCEVKKEAGKVVVMASPYYGYQVRKALVTVYYGHQEYKVQVQQAGHRATLDMPREGGFFRLKEGHFAYVGGSSTEFNAPITTNLNIDHVIVPDTVSWVTFERITEGSEGKKIVKLQLQPNRSNNDRYCTMTLQSSQNWDATVQFVLVQSKVGYNLIPLYNNMSQEVMDLGGKLRIPFDRDFTDGTYDVEVSADAQEWLKIPENQLSEGKLSSTRNELYANVDMNLTQTPRTGTITFTSQNNGKRYVLTLNQEQFQNKPPHNVVGASATAGNGSITLNWNNADLINYTKVEVEMSSSYDGIRPVKKVIDNVNTTTVTFDNTFRFAGQYTFTIKTYGPTNIETTELVLIKGTSNAWSQSVQIPLTANMLSTNANHSEGGGLPKLVDGVTNNGYFHSNYGGNSTDGKQHRIQIMMTTAITGEFYLDYYGRPNGNGSGDVKRAKIFVNESGADTDTAWSELGELAYTLPSGRGQHGATTSRLKTNKNILGIRFVPQERRNKVLAQNGARSEWFNLGELRLWSVRDEDWAKNNLQTIFPQ